MFATFAWVYGKLTAEQKEALEKLVVDVKDQHVGKGAEKIAETAEVRCGADKNKDH
jgi:hypothetical protein